MSISFPKWMCMLLFQFQAIHSTQSKRPGLLLIEKMVPTPRGNFPSSSLSMMPRLSRTA
uniref:Uncharacterized protein n=1 Tax=Rhizophora mucronata TaxID=61149 RepID=A0A2P2PJ55_RHIMU